jgi:hypothetical protein
MRGIYLAKYGRLHSPHLGFVVEVLWIIWFSEHFGSCCQRYIGCCRRSYSTISISQQNAVPYTVYLIRCLTHIVIAGMLTNNCFKSRDDYCFVAEPSDMRIIPKRFPYLLLHIQELCCRSTALRNITGRSFFKSYTYAWQQQLVAPRKWR